MINLKYTFFVFLFIVLAFSRVSQVSQDQVDQKIAEIKQLRRQKRLSQSNLQKQKIQHKACLEKIKPCSACQKCEIRSACSSAEGYIDEIKNLEMSIGQLETSLQNKIEQIAKLKQQCKKSSGETGSDLQLQMQLLQGEIEILEQNIKDKTLEIEKNKINLEILQEKLKKEEDKNTDLKNLIKRIYAEKPKQE